MHRKEQRGEVLFEKRHDATCDTLHHTWDFDARRASLTQVYDIAPGADPGVEIGGGHMASARAYNGGLGAMPPAGSRGRAPGQGVRGRSPLKLNAFWCCHVSEMVLNCYVYELFYGH